MTSRRHRSRRPSPRSCPSRGPTPLCRRRRRPRHRACRRRSVHPGPGPGPGGPAGGVYLRDVRTARRRNRCPQRRCPRRRRRRRPRRRCSRGAPGSGPVGARRTAADSRRPPRSVAPASPRSAVTRVPLRRSRPRASVRRRTRRDPPAARPRCPRAARARCPRTARPQHHQRLLRWTPPRPAPGGPGRLPRGPRSNARCGRGRRAPPARR